MNLIHVNMMAVAHKQVIRHLNVTVKERVIPDQPVT